MNRKHLKMIAESDLLAITRVRHQLTSIRFSRIAHEFFLAEQLALNMSSQLLQLRNETKLIRQAFLRAVTGNEHGVDRYQSMLRAIDVDTRRMHVRMDMQADECRRILGQLNDAKKLITGLEIRLEIYKKAKRKALAMREDVIE